MTENLGGVPGYWTDNTAEMSHGESFLAVFGSMFRDPGFYVMDEPEAALSFTSCLELVTLMHQLGSSGAQVVCATHSPILAATPGAEIIELGEHGLRRVEWPSLSSLTTGGVISRTLQLTYGISQIHDSFYPRPGT